MPRYIDADALIKKIFTLGMVGDGMYAINAKAVKFAIDNTPTADVAPNSEVERLEAEIETLKDNNEHLAVMLEEAKQGGDGFPCVAYNKKHERYQVIHKGKQGHIFASKLYRCRKEAENALAKLKKKYTEVEK